MGASTLLNTPLVGGGQRDQLLDRNALREIVRAGVENWPVPSGARCLAIIPDNTRSFSPSVLHEILAACRVRSLHLDMLIASGTHKEMQPDAIAKFLRSDQRPELFADGSIANHSEPSASLTQLGVIDAATIRQISGNRLQSEIPIRVNSRIFDYDLLVIVGPVFPHEVIGMSGGWKYFFPGISGAEMIDESHWLGALLGIGEVIGRSETPVRRLVEHAGAMVEAQLPVTCFSLVMGLRGLHGLFHGGPLNSHRAAAKLSREINVVYTDRRYRRVVAECPPKYAELWTAGKLAYKTQQVVEKGGQIVMYAPTLDKVAPKHPEVEKIGYHCMDYFLKQWDRFKNVEASACAHSTHVAGPGVYEDGHETLDARRILASQLAPAQCEAINLDYMDPSLIDFSARKPFGEDPETLWIPQAGEQLYWPASERHLLEEAER